MSYNKLITLGWRQFTWCTAFPTKQIERSEHNNEKITTIAAVLMSLMAGATAHAETRIGVTVYKYDDNFMAVVRKAIEKEAAANPGWSC